MIRCAHCKDRHATVAEVREAVQVVTDMLDVVGYSDGTGSVKFFAYDSSCLRSAIDNAIERSYE